MKAGRLRGRIAVALLMTALGCVAADLASADNSRDHVLFSAIRHGDRAVLESHLREGAPPNVRAADGTTPLMLAALHGTPELVELLLEYGADPNVVNKRGASALLFAVGDVRKVKLLVSRGADVNLRSALGNTPLVAAAAYSDNLDVVKLLIDHGADLVARNSNNVSALAAAVYAGDAESVRFFLEQGCKPEQIRNLFGAAGNSLLAVAAQMADARIVRMLLDHGADVNAVDANFAGHALNYALLAQSTDVALQLIEAGADLNQCSSIGKVPPLTLAAYSESGDVSVVKRLIQRGADVAAANQAGETALTWARRRGFPDVIVELTSAGTPEHLDAPPSPPQHEVPKETEARRDIVGVAIQKSLALMQHSSDVFLEKRRTCVSCHHQNLQGVALGWARDRGFDVDESSLDRMLERQRSTWSRRVDAAYEMDRPMPVPPQLLGYGMWGLSALGHSADALTDAYVWYLAAIQKPDGHWHAGGITRPPMGGSEIMSTVLAMRALQLYPLAGRSAEMRSRVEQARQWLADSQPQVHQDLVYKLLGLGWAGTPPHELLGDLTRLKELQRPDGGWAQLPQIESDAWATGQSLVALYAAGRISTNEQSFQRGVEFLLRTQFDDGSWFVQSRAWPFQPPFDSEFPFERDQWISAGATAWATMALLVTVDSASPSLVPGRSDHRPEPLVARTGAAGDPAPPAGDARPRTEPVDFAREIQPVLERSCAGCHSGETPEGGFLVAERDAILRGGESGDAAVVPGSSPDSPLFVRVSGTDADLAMPPREKRDKFPALSADELEAFRAWIDQGARWPDGVTVKAKAY